MSAKSGNITWQGGTVAPQDRRALLGHDGCVVWLTGLPASGKTTIARALESGLTKRGHLAYVLDGDNVRHGLNSDLGFSPADRHENIRRVGEVAGMMAEAGVITIAAFISPYGAGRDRARQAARGRPFLEVFCDAPLEACRRRDPRGLYAKAQAGEIEQMTGLDAPYEVPASPDIVLKTADSSVDDCVAAVLAVMADKGILRVCDTPRGRRP